MPISDPAKRAEKQRQYRTRDRLKAQAILMGIEEIPLVFFGLDRATGEYVAIDTNQRRIPLLAQRAASLIDAARPDAPPKAYSPRGMPKDQYETVTGKIRESVLSKEAAISSLQNSKDQKLANRMIALIEALPDGPDWAEHFPDWTES